MDFPGWGPISEPEEAADPHPHPPNALASDGESNLTKGVQEGARGSRVALGTQGSFPDKTKPKPKQIKLLLRGGGLKFHH